MLKKNRPIIAAGAGLITMALVIVFAVSMLLDRETQPGGTDTSTQTPNNEAVAPTPAIPTVTVELLPTQTESPAREYTDPDGQFRVTIPAGWEQDEEGSFTGKDGSLRLVTLPEMAFMDRVTRVCERLANTEPGIGRMPVIYPFPESDACILVPYPEMSNNQIRLVIGNPSGEPEQRYISLETYPPHLDSIMASLHLLNLPAEQAEFPYPNGSMRAADEAFWAKTSHQPEDLIVDEYAVVKAEEDSPTHFEFKERIPAEVLDTRAEEREGLWEIRLASNNRLLEPFGYSLKIREGLETTLYELDRGGELIVDRISEFWPAAVNASGSDFALVVNSENSGTQLVQKDSLAAWDMGASLFIPPVFSGDELLSVRWDGERSQVQVMQGEKQVYVFGALFLVDMPVKGMWSWEGHWLLEVDGFLIQDGQILNESLGYEEIFGWQLMDGKPFYFFRKGPRIGISYDGQVLPAWYDEIPHYRCCEASAFNNAGNEELVWFYGLREGMWYYVEIATHTP